MKRSRGSDRSAMYRFMGRTVGSVGSFHTVTRGLLQVASELVLPVDVRRGSRLDSCQVQLPSFDFHLGAVVAALHSGRTWCYGSYACQADLLDIHDPSPAPPAVATTAATPAPQGRGAPAIG